jgi:hypothetical protein
MLMRFLLIIMNYNINQNIHYLNIGNVTFENMVNEANISTRHIGLPEIICEFCCIGNHS